MNYIYNALIVEILLHISLQFPNSLNDELYIK